MLLLIPSWMLNFVENTIYPYWLYVIIDHFHLFISFIGFIFHLVFELEHFVFRWWNCLQMKIANLKFFLSYTFWNIYVGKYWSVGIGLNVWMEKKQSIFCRHKVCFISYCIVYLNICTLKRNIFDFNDKFDRFSLPSHIEQMQILKINLGRSEALTNTNK